MIYLLYIASIAAMVLLDQLFKLWITANFELYGSAPLITGLLRLHYIQNTGASFSILSGNRVLLLALTVICVCAVVYMLISGRVASKLGRWSLVLILGGALGNMIDRFRLGYVVDMFDLEFMNFPVFNVADCFITVGITLFALYIILDSAAEVRADRAAKDNAAGNAADNTAAGTDADTEVMDDENGDN